MIRAAILAALLAFAALPVAAQDTSERITDYASDIVVAKNGALTVTETISVIAQDESIRHGIYRDFPTTYTDKFGKTRRVGFDVISVSRDGHEEPYDLENIDSGQRIKIGDADTLLDPGPHSYTIIYTTTRQIGFYDNYDEVYWNVTGNFWQFPIDRAEATVRLPAGAHIIQSSYYTGAAGSRDQNAASSLTSDTVEHFETTAPLGANEGLTIAVGFNKGVVLPPSADELRADFIRDNASPIVAAAGVLILLVYFAVTWASFGRDPARGTIIPLFAPPANFSPAAVRFVHKMEYDRKAFAASLIDMAVKGYMKISEEHGDYTFTRTGRSEAECGLDDGETAIARQLFLGGGADSIELKQANHSDIAAAISGLKTTLSREYEKNYFVTNLHWAIGGLAILAVTALATGLLSQGGGGAMGAMFPLAALSVGVSVMVHRAWNAWQSVLYGPGSRFLNVFGALFLSAFAVPFAIGVVGIFVVFGGAISIPASIALVAGGIACYVFYHLLKAPTLAGAKIRDQIDGFRIFLDTAEKDRLEKLNPPNVTPEVFEKFLPYAIALDCENTWSRKFEAEASAAGSVPNTGAYYTPIWYSGGSFNRLGAAGFASAIGASLASSAASAATTPGSSSGSGGGGFSGGGGGGGGGGGW